METGNVSIRSESLCKMTRINIMAVSYLQYLKLSKLIENKVELNEHQARTLHGIKIIQDIDWEEFDNMYR